MSNSNLSSVTSSMLLIFIVFKLTHVINWSWWWVVSPLWIPFAIASFMVAIAMMSSRYRDNG